MKKIIKLIPAALIIMLLFACTSNKESTDDTVLIDGKSVNLPVAFTIDGTDVPLSKLRDDMFYFRREYDNQDDTFWRGEGAEEAVKTLRDAAVDNIKVSFALKKMADEGSIVLTEEEKTTALAQFDSTVEENGGIEVVEQMLAQQNLTMEFYKDQVVLNALFTKIYKEKFESLDVPISELRKIADESEYILVKHVLVTEDDLKAIEEKEKRTFKDLEELANEISKRAKDGEDFDLLIETYNSDPGMKDNTDGYFFTKGKMVPAFEEMSYSLAENAVSDPVLTDYGYHIILKLPITDEIIKKNQGDLTQGTNSEKMWAEIEKIKTAMTVEFPPEFEKITLLSFIPTLGEKSEDPIPTPQPLS